MTSEEQWENSMKYKPKFKAEQSATGRKYVSRDIPNYKVIPNGAAFVERNTSEIITFHVIPRNP